eukprot:g588.t1
MARRFYFSILCFALVSYIPGRNATPTFRELTTSVIKPSARAGHSSILFDEKMIIFGGDGGQNYNDVWALSASTWTKLETNGIKPSVRSSHSAVSYNEKMIVFGGSNYGVYAKNEVWVFDLTAYTWENVTTSPTKPSARTSHSSVVHGDQMVMFGGADAGAVRNDVWTLNLTSYNWASLTTSATKPSVRYGHSCILASGMMVLFGGRWDNSFGNDIWTLNLTSYVWTERTKTGKKPSARYSHSSIFYDSKMILYGGYNFDNGTFTDVWAYNLSSYVWSEVNISGPDPRYDHSSIVFNDKMLVFGGAGNGIKNDVWALDFKPQVTTTTKELTTTTQQTTTISPEKTTTTTKAPANAETSNGVHLHSNTRVFFMVLFVWIGLH